MGEVDIDRLREEDAVITALLKGPMSNLDRVLLVADRKDIRALIASTPPQHRSEG